LTQGVSPDLFRQRTGMPLKVIEAELKYAEENGLLVWDLATLKPTESGRRYLNDLLQYFMPETVTEKCSAD
jgi:coproporphyrinogen III oxidase-like Fe-S oxidoreductase